MGANECLTPKRCQRSVNTLLATVHLHGGGPHFVLNALEYWAEPSQIITDREPLGMRHAMCPVDCVVVS